MQSQRLCTNRAPEFCCGKSSRRLFASAVWRRALLHKTHTRTQALPVIKVVGVGGVASQAVAQLWDSDDGGSSLEMMLINTDVQELSSTFMPDHDKLLIGARATRWRGACGDAHVGKEAALESSHEISEALHGADVVFVLAGLGGGTGAGAASVVADLARQQGALTVSLATLPLSHPAAPSSGNEALASLQAAAGTLITVHSPAQQTGASPGLSGIADDIQQLQFHSCIHGIAQLITGLEPLGVDELQSILAGCSTVLGFATAQGPERVTRATYAAVSSPNCMAALQSASGVLSFVMDSSYLTEAQVEDVREVLCSQCSTAAAVHVRQVPAADFPLDAAAVTVIVINQGSSMTQDTGLGSGQEVSGTGEAGGTEGTSLLENLDPFTDP